MNRIFSIGLSICGGALIVYGLSAADSISSTFSNFFTGSPTDEAIWMLAGGATLLAIGLAGLFRGSSN
ncbi:DUF3185 family protein [Pelagicoccus sp. NFK12]|uniref:DUF3185 family protein n=1 Tax=Pelagicoccus enzymogenes TaxID=2773457 RepID=A0A927IH99_9BACT|nr:DUF3185 family protein [Pelagicoccus enzymogenes]MBD5779220.1 DUF3185 family protein [Pelagicoccus enzymogenes]MDQ8198426.1 DUF3185 family protein [Pelagicoccus enzymogenes]